MNLILLCFASALAQDGLDGHHFSPVPTLGGPLDLIGVWRPAASPERSFGLTGLFERSSAGLVQVYEDWNGVTEEVLLDDVTALNLGVLASPSRRLSLAVGAPLYLASTGLQGSQGAGIGDLSLSVPVGVIVPEGKGFAFSLVPTLTLPTGDESLMLGDPGLGFSALAAAGMHGERYTVDTNLGFRQRPEMDYLNQTGGGALVASLGAGYAVYDWLGVRGEVLYEAALSANDVAGTASPGEALLSLRGRTKKNLSYTLGGAAGISEGAGAPAWRAFAGLGWAYIKDPNRDTDLDGLVDDLDACDRDPEAKNGWRDEDGCPDSLASLAVVVQDEEGKPLAATVKLGDQTLTADAQGALALGELMPETLVTGEVSSEGYVTASLGGAALKEGANEVRLTLSFVPGTTRFLARDQSGKPVAATVTLEGPSAVAPMALGEDGRHQTVLPPGEWRVLVTAEGFGAEGRVLNIAADRPGLNKVEFTLVPPMVDVQKKEVVISEAVLFDFDAATLRPDSEPILRQVVGVLQSHPELKLVEIQGHTDDKGDALYNLDLSQRRVDAVMAWLVSQGVAADRLVAKGYGESSPIRSNASEAGRAANRRVQFMILKQE